MVPRSGEQPQPKEELPVQGKLLARSIHGDWVEQVGNKLILVRDYRGREYGGNQITRDEVTEEWLEQALEDGAWYKPGEEEPEASEAAIGLETAIPSPEVNEEFAPSTVGWEVEAGEEEAWEERAREEEAREEEEALPVAWEAEIASRLSFYDRVKPDMLSLIPKEHRASALREYARLHPDEAFMDRDTLAWRGKGR